MDVIIIMSFKAKITKNNKRKNIVKIESNDICAFKIIKMAEKVEYL